MSYNISTTEYAARARDVMEKKIEAGRASAGRLLEHVNTHVPEDSIVKAKAFEFAAPMTAEILSGGEQAQATRVDTILGSVVQRPGFEVSWQGTGRGVHRHALQQMASKAGIPGAYLAELAESKDHWQRALAAQILNEHFHKTPDMTKYLVRSTSGQVRGFLSDRYRRLDSRPLLEAFAESCQLVGAVPVDGVVSDTRVALKALLPMVFEPVPGEVMCLGIEWGNSDYGAARHTARAFILRLTCLNGATMEDALAQVHLGARISDDIEFSKRTYDLDTRASISALKDVVRGTLGEGKVNNLLEGIKSANEKSIDWRSMRTKIAKSLLKSELALIESAFQSEDVINLPAGKTLWRASNAVSWIAGKTEDQNRRLELERLAGEIVNGKRDGGEAEAA